MRRARKRRHRPPPNKETAPLRREGRRSITSCRWGVVGVSSGRRLVVRAYWPLPEPVVLPEPEPPPVPLSWPGVMPDPPAPMLSEPMLPDPLAGP